MIWDIYNALIDDELIAEKVGYNIKFYEYPEAKDIKENHIIIDPVAPPRPVKTADNERIIYEYFYQIDVWSKNITERDEIMNRISQILKRIGFGENGGIDEYDKDFKIFRVAKRFIGQFEKLEEVL